MRVETAQKAAQGKEAQVRENRENRETAAKSGCDKSHIMMAGMKYDARHVR